jgi:hypothetical protein
MVCRSLGKKSTVEHTPPKVRGKKNTTILYSLEGADYMQKGLMKERGKKDCLTGFADGNG